MIDRDSFGRTGVDKCDNMWRVQEVPSVSSSRPHRGRGRHSGVAASAESHALRTRWKGRRWWRLPNGKVQFVTVALMAAISLLCLASAPLLIDAQLAWSPIQVDSESKWMINIV